MLLSWPRNLSWLTLFSFSLVNNNTRMEKSLHKGLFFCVLKTRVWNCDHKYGAIFINRTDFSAWVHFHLHGNQALHYVMDTLTLCYGHSDSIVNTMYYMASLTKSCTRSWNTGRSHHADGVSRKTSIWQNSVGKGIRHRGKTFPLPY